MKLIYIIFPVIVLLCGFFLLYFYFENTKKVTTLYSPYVSTHVGEVAGDATTSAQLDSDIPVNCVLSYGTFMVGQQACDMLADSDTNQNVTEDTISCQLSEGTFSVTSQECALLKKSVGSRDILKSLDK